MLDDNGIQDSLVARGERIVTWYAGYRKPMLQRGAGVSVSCLGIPKDVTGGEVCQQQKLKKPMMQAWPHFDPQTA